MIRHRLVTKNVDEEEGRAITPLFSWAKPSRDFLEERFIILHMFEHLTKKWKCISCQYLRVRAVINNNLDRDYTVEACGIYEPRFVQLNLSSSLRRLTLPSPLFCGR